MILFAAGMQSILLLLVLPAHRLAQRQFTLYCPCADGCHDSMLYHFIKYPICCITPVFGSLRNYRAAMKSNAREMHA